MDKRVALPGATLRAEHTEVSIPVDGWVRLCDNRGRVQACYHPGLLLLIIQDRGKKTIHDLNHRRHDDRLKAVPNGA